MSTRSAQYSDGDGFALVELARNLNEIAITFEPLNGLTAVGMGVETAMRLGWHGHITRDFRLVGTYAVITDLGRKYAAQLMLEPDFARQYHAHQRKTS